MPKSRVEQASLGPSRAAADVVNTGIPAMVIPAAGIDDAGIPAPRPPAIDAYIAKAAEFARPILRHLRDAMHQAVPEIAEEIKWSRPFFVDRGGRLGNMAAFKQHCSFGLCSREVASELRVEGVISHKGMGASGKLIQRERQQT